MAFIDSFVSGIARTATTSAEPVVARTVSEPWDAAIRVIRRQGPNWHAVSGVGMGDLADSPAESFDGLERQLVALRTAAPDSELVISALARTADGFDIDMFFENNHIRASFGGLVHEFTKVGLAMTWLRRAMSQNYHLRTVFVGDKPYEWRLEPAIGGGCWEDSLVSGHWRPFAKFRAKRVTYRQNQMPRTSTSACADVHKERLTH